MSLFLMKELLHDVYFYFRGGIREQVKDRVREQLSAVPAGSKVGLVGHSLGTVVALDVLASDRRRVDWFCTLGSPLGFRAIQAQMGIDAGAISGVAGSWNNLADRIDPVALDETLADDYPSAGVTDGLIVNEYENAAGHRNPHRLYGYLHAPETGELVRDFLGS
jgi:pimeloyl-ACP methyl ester carboxylesterase